MIITQKKLSDLHKPAHNIRRHSEKQLHEYVRSIEMFGQVKPLVVAEDGEIIAGNGLYEALLRMGRETCDCYVMVGLTNVQKKKLMMADNKVYELGFTDVDVIEELVKELDGDVDVPGWDADLLEMLNSTEDEADEMIGSYGDFRKRGIVHQPPADRGTRSVCRNPDLPGGNCPTACSCRLRCPTAAIHGAGGVYTCRIANRCSGGPQRRRAAQVHPLPEVW